MRILFYVFQNREKSVKSQMLKFDTLWDFFFFSYSNTKTTSLPKISFLRVKIGGEILECLCSDDSIACIAGISIGYVSVFVCVKSPC